VTEERGTETGLNPAWRSSPLLTVGAASVVIVLAAAGALVGLSAHASAVSLLSGRGSVSVSGLKSDVHFFTSPASCGGVVFAGQTYASGARAQVNPGLYPASAIACTGMVLSQVTVVGPGSFDPTASLLTVHGSIVVTAVFGPSTPSTSVGPFSTDPVPGSQILGTMPHCHGNMSMGH
jgi:hypothetical protein